MLDAAVWEDIFASPLPRSRYTQAIEINQEVKRVLLLDGKTSRDLMNFKNGAAWHEEEEG